MTPLEPQITSGILLTSGILGAAVGFAAARILHHLAVAIRHRRLRKWPRAHRTVLFR